MNADTHKGNNMSRSTEQQAVINALEEKQTELKKLQDLMLKSKLPALLKNQAAPSAMLERDNVKYFDKLIAIFQKCDDLSNAISEVLTKAGQDNPASPQDMDRLLNLVAQLKDDLSSAFGELVAFETNAVYDNMRKEIKRAAGKTAIADILSLLKASTNLLQNSALINDTAIKAIIDQEVARVKQDKTQRNYVKAKDELVESEKTFRKDMRTLSELNRLDNLSGVLRDSGYPAMSKLLAMSTEIYQNSIKLQELFEAANADPRLYSTPQAQELIRKAYEKLTEATALKAQIDKEELALFQADSSPNILKLKSSFEKVDQRGLSAYLVMPYQRAARYPILFKAVLDPISSKEADTDRFVAPISNKYPEWNMLNAQLADFNAYAKQVNQSLMPQVSTTPLTSVTPVSAVPKKDWKRVEPKAQARAEFLARKEAPPLPPLPPITSNVSSSTSTPTPPPERPARRAAPVAWQAVQLDKQVTERSENLQMGKRAHSPVSTTESKENSSPAESPEHKRRNTAGESSKKTDKEDTSATTRKKF